VWVSEIRRVGVSTASIATHQWMLTRVAGKQGEARQQELKEGIGGKEQSGDNPLGL
jgi:hypothetical protein